MTIGRDVDRTVEQPEAEVPELRARRLGAFAGLVAIGCCIYPVVLVLFGLATAAEAVSIGYDLYGSWGWVFRGAGALLAGAGIWYQVRRRRACAATPPRTVWPFVLRVSIVGGAVYAVVYGITTGLAALGS